MCQERSAGAAQHGQGTGQHQHGEEEEEEEEAQLPWPGCTLLREPIHTLGTVATARGGAQRIPLLKVQTEAAPETPEIPGASSCTGAEREMRLSAGLGSPPGCTKGRI